MDVDKEQAKINREDAKLLELCLDTKLWRPTLAWVCVLSFHVSVLSYAYNKWVCALRGKIVTTQMFSQQFCLFIGLTGARSFDKLKISQKII